MRKIVFWGIAALLFGLLPKAHATTIDPVTGSQGFDTPLLVQADASPTGNINTATVFTLSNMQTTNEQTGVFVGLPVQDFGTVTLTPGSATGFDFGNAVFGHFASTSISVTGNTSGFLNLLIEGDFTPGTFESTMRPGMAEYRASLTQTPPMNGSISYSGTMSITAIPEPSTLLLFGTGIGLLGLLFWTLEKRQKPSQTV